MKKKFVLVLIIIAAVFFIYKKWLPRDGEEGVFITPENLTYPAFSGKAFLQYDDKWKADHLGSSKYTMKSSGCLVSAIASMLTDSGIETDPGALNKIFSEKGVYTEQGDVIWNHIKKIYPHINIHIAGSVNGKKISEFLAERKFPLVRVKVHKKGYQHWLLIVGVKNNEFMCLDSLDPSKQPVPLSVHGKVYSWRVLYF